MLPKTSVSLNFINYLNILIYASAYTSMCNESFRVGLDGVYAQSVGFKGNQPTNPRNSVSFALNHDIVRLKFTFHFCGKSIFPFRLH